MFIPGVTDTAALFLKGALLLTISLALAGLFYPGALLVIDRFERRHWLRASMLVNGDVDQIGDIGRRADACQWVFRDDLNTGFDRGMAHVSDLSHQRNHVADKN